MANEFFEPGAQRAAKVNALFSRIAPRYDLMNDLQSFGLHRYWKRRVLRLAGAGPGLRALDVCCGTGDLALGMARQGASVVGLDCSEAMLRVAQDRQAKVSSLKSQVSGLQSQRQGPEATGRGAEAEASPNPRFIQGDAQRLPFSDNTFDIVTVGYGLRNLAEWEVGLREMQRVAKPGGRLLVLDFGKPDNALWRAAYFGYLQVFVPVLGKVFCGSASAYAYILESLQHYPAQHGVAAQMQALGLTPIGLVQLLGGVMSINYGQKAPRQ